MFLVIKNEKRLISTGPILSMIQVSSLAKIAMINQKMRWFFCFSFLLLFHQKKSSTLHLKPVLL